MKHYIVSNRDVFKTADGIWLFHDEWGDDTLKLRYGFLNITNAANYEWNLNITPLLRGDNEETQTVQYTEKDPLTYTSGSKRFFMDLFDDFLNSSEDKNRTLIFIHGHNVAMLKSINFLIEMESMYVSNPESAFKRILSFSWPSNTGLIQHEESKSRTPACGHAFSIFYRKLYQFCDQYLAKYFPDKANRFKNSFDIMLQSQGNLLFGHAVKRLTFPAGTDTLKFSDVYLMAADVNDDYFEDRKPFSDIEKIAKRVHVYYRKDDKALAKSEYWSTLVNRLGMKGPKNFNVKPGIVFSVDVNKVDDIVYRELGDDHRYFVTSKRIARDISRIHRSDDLSRIDGRRTAGSNRAELT